MCLILLALDVVPQRPLLLLGNRDEFHVRASAAAAPWVEDARVVGGRDLVAGGSWLAARSDGRFAVVTNVRSGIPATAPRSRGALVSDFVLGRAAPEDYLRAIHAMIDEYGPFNLVVGQAGASWLLSSTGGEPGRLPPGMHVISNGAPGVVWPKTARLAQGFAAWLAAGEGGETAALELLHDRSHPQDAALPDTGVGIELERLLAPVFVQGEHYGTRASTLLVHGRDGVVCLRERSFGSNGIAGGEACWQASSGAPFEVCANA